MSDGTKPLGSAILSLLVAADQRCPAIIGKAHLLYDARFGTKPENAEKAFAQMKRDAADLFEAIADVEAAMKRSKTVRDRGEFVGSILNDDTTKC